MTLPEFLLARIAEDEARGRQVHADYCDTPAETMPDSMGRPMSPTCDCDWHISRVLAECEAKRRIVERHKVLEPLRFGDDDPALGLPHCNWCKRRWPCADLRALALPYADHPDYREEWKP